jgi:hypothetical protein
VNSRFEMPVCANEARLLAAPRRMVFPEPPFAGLLDERALLTQAASYLFGIRALGLRATTMCSTWACVRSIDSSSHHRNM